jgi:hypothetical protein
MRLIVAQAGEAGVANWNAGFIRQTPGGESLCRLKSAFPARNSERAAARRAGQQLYFTSKEGYPPRPFSLFPFFPRTLGTEDQVSGLYTRARIGIFQKSGKIFPVISLDHFQRDPGIAKSRLTNEVLSARAAGSARVQGRPYAGCQGRPESFSPPVSVRSITPSP